MLKIWQKLIILTVLPLFLLKAVIPAGFMPDLTSLHQGIIKMTICTWDGTKDIDVDANTLQPVDNHTQKTHQKICPFAATLTSFLQAFIILIFGVVVFSTLFLTRLITKAFVFHKPSLLFPRAPPAAQ